MAKSIYLLDKALEDTSNRRERSRSPWCKWQSFEARAAQVTPSFGVMEAENWIIWPSQWAIGEPPVFEVQEEPIEPLVLQPESEQRKLYWYLFTTVPPGVTSLILGNFTVGCQALFPVLFFSRQSSLPPAVERRLAELRRLPEAWDSYGARRVSAEAIEKVKSILLRSCAIGGFGFCQQSFIAPSANGGLAVEWDLPSGKELVLEIPPEGEPIAFLFADPTRVGGEKEKEGSIRQTEDLDEILLKIIG